MTLLKGACREVLDETEVVAMVTEGPDGPHITATWGDYVRALGIGTHRLRHSAGFHRQVQPNLLLNPSIPLVDSGEDMDRVKAAFPWARGALIVDVTEAVAHLQRPRRSRVVRFSERGSGSVGRAAAFQVPVRERCALKLGPLVQKA